ncbi:MAG: glycine cleavage system aminomethyltransferase GcvT [Sporomusaceae bacterium]|nr:glycine cleavage system aminomethyltransferase GcvT [Sporomusaceae bacterium]
MTAKQTPLYETHLRCGGKMVEFGGWLLPVQYSGIKDEHQAVRTRAGLFDVSHMGEVLVAGEQALPFLQKLVTNDVSRLQIGQILYTPMCFADGGTVDDLLIYRLAEREFMLVLNAANIDKDWQWLQENAAGFAVELQNRSDDTALLALQGPKAQAILTTLTDVDLDGLRYYRFYPKAAVAGATVLLSRTGYTGEDGFELYCRRQDAVGLWDAIMAAGKPFALLPAGLGCRDTLRFEAGLPLYGHELSASITPVEAGLGMFVKPDKGDFNGCGVLAAQKTAGAGRRLVGFVMLDRGIARAGYPVFADGAAVGMVTSGTYAPTLNQNLGLALIQSEYAGIGQTLEVEIRGKRLRAKSIARPFYKREGI